MFLSVGVTVKLAVLNRLAIVNNNVQQRIMVIIYVRGFFFRQSRARAFCSPTARCWSWIIGLT